MIQRKQTLFLLFAFLLTIVCLCMPLGEFKNNHGLNESTVLYNLWMTTPDGNNHYEVWGLFAVLLLTCPIMLFAIFMYHNRKTQSRFCMFSILLTVGWYIEYAVMVLTMKGSTSSYIIYYTSVLPAASLILQFMARRAILADEALVRAADRIR